jgi:hypothetical protein
MWHFFNGEPVSSNAGVLFQIYPKEIRRRTTDIFDVAIASPLPKERFA